MNINSSYYLIVPTRKGHLIEQKEGAEFDIDDLLLNRPLLSSLDNAFFEVEVTLGSPESFQPTDYLRLPHPIVSERFKACIEKFDLPGIDFYPCKITSGDSNWNNYYALHIWNTIAVVDHEHSDYKGSNCDITILKKVSLDAAKLLSAPSGRRQLFCLAEHPTYLFHQDIVNALKKEKIEGVQFLSAEDWSLKKSFAYG